MTETAPDDAGRSAKGYWIVGVDITDPDGYARYRALNGAAFRKYGGRFLVRGGRSETLEGTARARTVVVEFPSYAAALACHRSPEYQAAIAARAGAVLIDLVVVEGYDGDQP